jgi:hypothetical protein
MKIFHTSATTNDVNKNNLYFVLFLFENFYNWHCVRPLLFLTPSTEALNNTLYFSDCAYNDRC